MIHFTMVYNQQEIVVQTSPHSYPSLMSLVSDYLSVPGFGLCSGMGSCGTCVVYVDGMRMVSCELAINDELDDSRITIKDTLG